MSAEPASGARLRVSGKWSVSSLAICMELELSRKYMQS